MQLTGGGKNRQYICFDARQRGNDAKIQQTFEIHTWIINFIYPQLLFERRKTLKKTQLKQALFYLLVWCSPSIQRMQMFPFYARPPFSVFRFSSPPLTHMHTLSSHTHAHAHTRSFQFSRSAQSSSHHLISAFLNALHEPCVAGRIQIKVHFSQCVWITTEDAAHCVAPTPLQTEGERGSA